MTTVSAGRKNWQNNSYPVNSEKPPSLSSTLFQVSQHIRSCFNQLLASLNNARETPDNKNNSCLCDNIDPLGCFHNVTL